MNPFPLAVPFTQEGDAPGMGVPQLRAQFQLAVSEAALAEQKLKAYAGFGKAMRAVLQVWMQSNGNIPAALQQTLLEAYKAYTDAEEQILTVAVKKFQGTAALIQQAIAAIEAQAAAPAAGKIHVPGSTR